MICFCGFFFLTPGVFSKPCLHIVILAGLSWWHVKGDQRGLLGHALLFDLSNTEKLLYMPTSCMLLSVLSQFGFWCCFPLTSFFISRKKECYRELLFFLLHRGSYFLNILSFSLILFSVAPRRFPAHFLPWDGCILLVTFLNMSVSSMLVNFFYPFFFLTSFNSFWPPPRPSFFFFLLVIILSHYSLIFLFWKTHTFHCFFLGAMKINVSSLVSLLHFSRKLSCSILLSILCILML